MMLVEKHDDVRYQDSIKEINSIAWFPAQASKLLLEKEGLGHEDIYILSSPRNLLVEVRNC